MNLLDRCMDSAPPPPNIRLVLRPRIVYSDLVGYQTSDIRLLWTITPPPPMWL